MGNKRRNLGDTQPMQPVNPQRAERAERRTQRGQKNYREAYERELEYRRAVSRTPATQNRSGQRSRSRQQESSLSAIIQQMRKKKKKEGTKYFDYDLLLVIIFLMCFGLIMLYSTSAYTAQVENGNDMFYFTKQAIIGAVGILIMLAVSKIDYHIYAAFHTEIFLVAMVLMALVKTPLGMELNGARRWIQLPGNMSFQPAEVTKIAVILFISYKLCEYGKKAYGIRGWLKIGAYGGVAAGGVFVLTDNLSTAIIVMAITVLLLFLVHPKTKRFVVFACVVLVLAVIVVVYLKIQISDMATSTDFRMRRIIAWLNPEANSDKDSYQFLQGLYAIGSGGFFGKGLGNSTQKLSAIPEAQNDMILTVICEELGVFGAILILCLFGFMLYRLMFIARNAPDLYGSLIAAGIFSHIALQVILNIAVVTGLIPTTGVTLPFISYGGTAVVFLLAEMGIALGISSKIELKD